MSDASHDPSVLPPFSRTGNSLHRPHPVFGVQEITATPCTTVGAIIRTLRAVS